MGVGAGLSFVLLGPLRKVVSFLPLTVIGPPTAVLPGYTDCLQTRSARPLAAVPPPPWLGEVCVHSCSEVTTGVCVAPLPLCVHLQDLINTSSVPGNTATGLRPEMEAGWANCKGGRI